MHGQFGQGCYPPGIVWTGVLSSMNSLDSGAILHEKFGQGCYPLWKVWTGLLSSMNILDREGRYPPWIVWTGVLSSLNSLDRGVILHEQFGQGCYPAWTVWTGVLCRQWICSSPELAAVGTTSPRTGGPQTGAGVIRQAFFINFF